MPRRRRQKGQEPQKDPVKNAFTTIRVLTKYKREAFAKMMLEGKEDF